MKNNSTLSEILEKQIEYYFLAFFLGECLRHI